MIVYLARAIQAFVMYCVNGTSSSSLLIESTDSMIESTDSMISVFANTPTYFMSTCTSYVPTHIDIEDMRTKR